MKKFGGFVFPKAAQNLRNDFVRSLKQKKKKKKKEEEEEEEEKIPLRRLTNHNRSNKIAGSFFPSPKWFWSGHKSRGRAGGRVETTMDDCKRVVVMTTANNAGCMSKRRRIAGSSESLRPSASRSDLDDRCLWLENATTSLSRLENKNSIGIIAGGEMSDGFSEDQFPVSCCFSNDCRKATAVKDAGRFEDLETKSFETVESIRVNGIQRESTPTSNLMGDSDEMDSPATIFLTEKQKPTDRPMKTPPISEIEDFFSEAEKYEQKRFSEKYNFDIIMDVPLEGRYQWIRLKP
ncbi:cyclin-dependent kinase inhibitor 7 isoform X1 [Cucumis sativus]|uniref:cyclin-dependent kinase inhibitor 7 isoform X1 n=1 Tax=Cucumis sativus TaxID=3659 RepID=UPI0012F4CD21|nr:cyclin-dependent kinase inhibitor 7 isoform X1 [Cucumis sativus]